MTFWGSVSFRIALVYGALMVCTLTVMSAVFYYGTVDVESHVINQKLEANSRKLSSRLGPGDLPLLQQEVGQLLEDGIDQDTEVYLLLAPDGHKLAGNLDRWPAPESVRMDTVHGQDVLRYGKPSRSRLLWHRLPDGAILVVGRDMQDQRANRALVWRSLAAGGGIALLLTFLGALLFRRQIGRSIATIRHTALEIQGGDLSRRIPVGPADDEFAHLSGDINHMLDRIEQLLEGVRQVSDTIAHNVRTPLARIRSQLDDALAQRDDPEKIYEAAGSAIHDLDVLALVFEKLMQIAAAESGTARQAFEPVAVASVITDVAELYGAMAEMCGVALRVDVQGNPAVKGDRELLAAALANLLENSIRYAPGSDVQVTVMEQAGQVVITVEDRGPGLPPDALHKADPRFYRLHPDISGNGLGLSIVSAIVRLHEGSLQLENSQPGLRVRITLPRTEPVTRSAGIGSMSSPILTRH